MIGCVVSMRVDASWSRKDETLAAAAWLSREQGDGVVIEVRPHVRAETYQGFVFLVRMLARSAENLHFKFAFLLKMLQEYYDGFRFAPEAAERMYNSTLMSYFMRQVATSK